MALELHLRLPVDQALLLLLQQTPLHHRQPNLPQPHPQQQQLDQSPVDKERSQAQAVLAYARLFAVSHHSLKPLFKVAIHLAGFQVSQ
jgi:hypothetical protein